MGSGHFLVTAVDFLSDYVAELVEYVPRGTGVARRRVRVAARGPRRGDQARHPRPRTGVRLGDGRGAAHRPGDPAPDGAEALHLRRGQEPAHRRARQGVAVAAQLHGRRAAVVPRPPPARRRLARRDARAGGDGRAETPGRAVRQLRDRPSRNRHDRDAVHREDVRRGRRRGTAVRLAVPARRGDDGGSAWPSRLPVRPPLADRRDAQEDARHVRSAR